MELGFRLLQEPQIALDCTFGARFGNDARSNAEAARWLLAVFETREVEIHGPLIPEEGVRGGLPQSDTDLDELRLRAEVYNDVARIESALGLALPLPDTIKVEEIDTIGTVAQILETRQGTATFHEATGEADVTALPLLEQQFSGQTIRRNVQYELWGGTLDLGPAEYKLPEVKVTAVRSLGTGPNDPAQVRVAPSSNDQMTFRLVDDERPRTAAGGVLLG